MQSRYKVIISSRNIYKEIDLLPVVPEVRVGTETDCEVRLRKDMFFEPIGLDFAQNNDQWTIYCSDNLYIDAGDVRKLLTKTLNHGDVFSIKYQGSNNDVFTVEFLIDFDNGQRRYERAIDVSACSVIRIGVDNLNQIIIHSPFVLNDSIELNRTNNGYALKILKTTYGVYHNGSKASGNCIIKNGDFFSISDFIFYIKDGYIWAEIRDGITVNGLGFGDYALPTSYPKFTRNSRIKTILEDKEIEILDPPTKPEKPKNNLFMNLLPSLGMLVASGAMAAMGGTTMIIFSAISGGMAIFTSVLGMVQQNKDFKVDSAKRIEKYNNYINNKKAEIGRLRDQERETLERIYTNSDSEIELLYRFSSDLFDRLPNDDDYLCVRLGTGNIVANRKINYKKQERLEADDDLQVIPEKLSEESEILQNAPVICDLKKANAIGILGPEEYRFALLKNILLDLCTRHYHSDVGMFIISKEENKQKINWLRFIPNFYNDVIGTRNIVCDDDSKNRIFDFLYKELTQREQGIKGNDIVVFFYDEYGFQNHPISKFISTAKDLGVTFIFMADDKSLIPLGCDYLIQLDSLTAGTLIETSNMENVTAFTFSSVDNNAIQRAVELLAPVCTEEISLEGSLTKNISLFELLNILAVDDLDLQKRWDNSKVSQSMSAPLGVSKMGIVSLDLHDKAHGPHGLVAGTTGSGKSEILQTYILSIATLFHPYEVSFLIIDFKGGGMVNQFKNLPHLLGAITNIDGKEIDRSLKSIKAELQKRQRLFAEVEVNHIDKYIAKFKSGAAKTPIPHLVVIVDEFAELKAEQPEFMKELISAARIGRSLGVHLILATQKPSGQVDEQIWSNSRFKLCLKVQSQEDSNEVLKSPLAAEIKEPGRAYFQVGNNEVFELFQSAYSGAPEKIDDSNIKEFSIFAFNESGRRVPVFVQKKKKSSGNVTQLESIVDYVHDFCEEKKIKKLDNICLPSLKDVLDYPSVAQKKDGFVDIGIYDDPDNQYQGEAWVDIDNKNTLILGSSQFGKTNILQSLIRNISSNCSSSEANIYIIDFGSMVLKNFEELKHVGGVVVSSEDEKLKNLFKLLFSEIASRKDKLVAVGVSSFVSYLEAGYTDMPHIYLIIDNLTALIELYLEDDDSLLNIIREGLSVGISVIVTNAQTTGIGYKYLSNFANKIALYCNDSNEYGNLFDHVTTKPDEKPGRCVLEIEKRMLECQTYLAFNGKKEIDRVREMQQVVADVNSKNDSKARIIPSIPSVLTKECLAEDFNSSIDGLKIPIGLTYKDVEPFYFDLSQLGLIGLCGKENTGHRNIVTYIIDSLRTNSTGSKFRLVVFDDISRKFSFLKDVAERYVLGSDGISDVIGEWHSILETRYQNLMDTESVGEDDDLLLMIIQNNDVAKRIQDDFDAMNNFTDIVTRFKGMNACIIFANYPNTSISYDAPEPIRMIKQEQHLLFFDDLDNLKPFDIAYEELKANRKRVETGDGYYIQDNSVTKLKLVKAE